MEFSNPVVSRDFAFLIENALPGPYVISFDYCIDEIIIIDQKDGAVQFNVDEQTGRDVFCACGAVDGMNGQSFLH